MGLKKLFQGFFKQKSSSLEKQKDELSFKASQLGFYVVEQDEFAKPLRCVEHLQKLISEQASTASTNGDNEKLTDLSLEQLQTKLKRIMSHSYTLLRRLSWSVNRGSTTALYYANTVTGFIADTLHNAPSMLDGRYFPNMSEAECKECLIKLIQEYLSVQAVLREHLNNNTELDEKVKHYMRAYYNELI
ncbi:hypothetical protein ABC382_00370 [Lysinibacillus sp. 1P01SD]|uniref:hypothetical protein n=1 Tax=Lysinibacillus sp. 1P01SD TaxID=3132285 RepID=UPI0039A05A90